MNKQAIAIRKVIVQLERIAKALDDAEKAEPDPRQGTLIEVFKKEAEKEQQAAQIMGVYI